MTTHLDVPTLQVIRCASLDDFQNQLLTIYKRIEEDGFAIVEAWDTSDETFKEIAQFFGHIQNPPKADELGIVKVRTERQRKPENAYERYPGHVPGEFLPHTDGSYLDGFGVVNSQVVRVNPPSLVIMQCIQPAEWGGASSLVDTQEILQRLWVEEPEHAKVVTHPRTVSYCAGEHFSTYGPLFEQLSHERWRVRLRLDVMYIEPWAYASVKHVVENYLHNPRFRKLHRLTEGQILIVDNYRMLHGRDAFISNNVNQSRLLNKTWIWEPTTEQLLPFTDAPPDPDSFKAFEKHLPLDVANKMLRPLQTGIKLKSKMNPV